MFSTYTMNYKGEKDMAKRIGYSLLTFLIMLIAIMLVSFSHATIASAAQAGATPKIYCTYTDENGVDVDGNKLTAGTYEINFVAEGFEKLSVVQLTATVSEGAAVNSIDSLLSDTSSDLASMGTVNSDGNLVFGFVPDTDNNGMSVSGAVTLATVKMTFDSACDAANYISVSSNPNLTFVSTDYSIENNDEYALVDTFDGYNGALTLMKCDVTPIISESACSISGKIVMANDILGSCSEFGVRGITVNVKNNDDIIASDVTGDDGTYTLSLPTGEYSMTISGPTTVDRTVTLVVSEDKVVDPVGVIITDYNHDGFVNGVDLGNYLVYHNKTDSDIPEEMRDLKVYFDLSNDGFVNGVDLGIYLNFHNKYANYDNVTLK